jgi:hypothetical protein
VKRYYRCRGKEFTTSSSHSFRNLPKAINNPTTIRYAIEPIMISMPFLHTLTATYRPFLLEVYNRPGTIVIRQRDERVVNPFTFSGLTGVQTKKPGRTPGFFVMMSNDNPRRSPHITTGIGIHSTPDYCSTKNSIRRFCARPSSVSFKFTGSFCPRPIVRIRLDAIPFSTSQFLTVCARSNESF